jgi:hypothetical protein
MHPHAANRMPFETSIKTQKDGANGAIAQKPFPLPANFEMRITVLPITICVREDARARPRLIAARLSPITNSVGSHTKFVD